jgi:hypothetical protein
MTFWVGFCDPCWLERTAVPACVSFGRLRKRKRLPKPLGPVFLDSRGFSEINQHGRYTFAPEEYAAFVARCRDEWGEKLVGASVMDWMCEPFVLAKTGLTVAEHQRRTVASWVQLKVMAPSLPWVPVLQGWQRDDYHRCADLYAEAGTDLGTLPLVGLGSVCRRQGTTEAAGIVRSLVVRRGLDNLHGLVGRHRLARLFRSSDSMAWSTRGRKAWDHDGRRLCGGDDHPGSCSNCLRWALTWREKLVHRIDRVTRTGATLFR